MLPRQIGCFLAADGPLCGSVRLFLCLGRRDGGPGQNSKRDAGRVSGQDGGGEERTVGAPGRTAKEARAVSVLPAGQENMRRPCGASGWWCSGQNCKRDAVRGGISDQAGEVRAVRRFGIRSRRQRGRRGEGRSDRRQRGRRGRVGVTGGGNGAGTAWVGEARTGAARIGEAR